MATMRLRSKVRRIHDSFYENLCESCIVGLRPFGLEKQQRATAQGGIIPAYRNECCGELGSDGVGWCERNHVCALLGLTNWTQCARELMLGLEITEIAECVCDVQYVCVNNQFTLKYRITYINMKRCMSMFMHMKFM